MILTIINRSLTVFCLVWYTFQSKSKFTHFTIIFRTAWLTIRRAQLTSFIYVQKVAFETSLTFHLFFQNTCLTSFDTFYTLGCTWDCCIFVEKVSFLTIYTIFRSVTWNTILNTFITLVWRLIMKLCAFYATEYVLIKAAFLTGFRKLWWTSFTNIVSQKKWCHTVCTSVCIILITTYAFFTAWFCSWLVT